MLFSEVQEKVKQWQERLGSNLGLLIAELTGDTESNQDAGRAENANVICTTPEKFGERPSSMQLSFTFTPGKTLPEPSAPLGKSVNAPRSPPRAAPKQL